MCSHLFTEKIPPSCSLIYGQNSGTFLSTVTPIKPDPFYCQLECQINVNCNQYNFNLVDGQCDLLSDVGSSVNNNFITGPKMCGQNWTGVDKGNGLGKYISPSLPLSLSPFLSLSLPLSPSLSLSLPLSPSLSFLSSLSSSHCLTIFGFYLSFTFF